METQLLSTSQDDIAIAAKLLKSGEVVAIPTETVYGLAANAFDEAAVRKVFEAKGRPCDNPLIVHISSLDMIKDIASSVPELAMACAKKFWPGPLTMIMPKCDKIPLVTSGGLDTVGIRFPSHTVAAQIITACGLPLAAPSANLSGSPSPTNAKRTMEDMNGRIPAVVDGGESDIGVESTVISFKDDGIIVLRPGKVSVEDLKTITDKVYIDDGVLNKIAENAKVSSPGMKYKHYAPKANVILVDGTVEAFREYVIANLSEGCYCLLFSKDEAISGVPYLLYGETADDQAHYLFEQLRVFDELGAKTVFARCPSQEGIGLAVLNRILRSAGFNLVSL